MEISYVSHQFFKTCFFEISDVALWRQLGDSKMYVYRGSLTRLNLSTKVCLKTINFQIVAVSRPCIRFFSFRYCFKALTECSLVFVVSRFFSFRYCFKAVTECRLAFVVPRSKLL